MRLNKLQQDTLLAEVVRLQEAGARFTLEFDPVSLLAMSSAVQLAMRHPGMPKETYRLLQYFLSDLVEYVNHHSAMFGQLLAAGNDSVQAGEPVQVCDIRLFPRPGKM